MKRRTAWTLPLIAVAATVLAACASAPVEGMQPLSSAPSAPNRQAQAEEELEAGEALGAGRWPSQVTCGQRYSWTFTLKIVNRTGGPLTMAAGDIDCYDWSGPGTPSTVMSGQVVQAGETRTFTMEPRDNVSRNWTMGIFSGSRLVGVFRASIPAGSSKIRVSDGSQTGNYGCNTVTVGDDRVGIPTPQEIPMIDSSTILLWSDGAAVRASACASDSSIFRVR